MTLRTLTPEELHELYYAELKRTFPPSELKPLKSMEILRRQNRYEPLGLFQGEKPVAYAFLWLEPGIPFALLDYLGTVEGRRGGGLGTQLLDLLAEHYAHYRGIFGEAEAPTAQDPAEAALQRRRLGFYQRNGFRYGGYDCALFGVHYQTLIRGDADVSPQELLRAHTAIYKSHLPDSAYQRFIQIPLPEGDQPKSPAPWVQV